ncbi:uncharacterized protein LOC115749311 isoform X3 [Rhodamnia argentea]|uniref:Uncharacterized protein LOC115749311 isoform X3 n=1 Tax=Rhodamnia argentea TaxID=178133 RepID=A0A8B8Q4C9_9MYRT|nr:uncharacterized protein LOC115749311 isoform X3 [Rhodamnia argentea]
MEGPIPRAVFIDTSLGTHLAMLISDTDTVSDLKRKIKVEHKACFPTLGEIHVNAVKVKRKGDFYHLADSMHVRSAFNGVKKNWFVSVDASILSVYSDGRNRLNPSSSDQPVLLAITSKPSSDQLDTTPDDQPETVPKRLSRFEVSATPKAGSYQNVDKVVPVIASENLVVEQNDVIDCSNVNRMTPLPSLWMKQNTEISTSIPLSTEPLDVCDSFTTGSRNKKREKNEKKSKACNLEDLSHPSSRKAIRNEMEVQKESLVFDRNDLIGEPENIMAPNQSIQSPKTSEPQQASFKEKPLELVQEKGKNIEMHDVNSHKQYSGDGAGDGVHSCSLVVREPDHSKKEFGQNKVTGGIEKAILTGESVAASKIEELKALPKKRKKSKRLKESDGGKSINSFTEHIESSLIGRSLADLQKVSEGDESRNKLENQENFLSQARGEETMVMAAAEPLDMHGTKVESSQQVIEKNMDIESIEEKTKKKSKKSRRSTVENLPGVEMKDPNLDVNDPILTSATGNETTTSHRRPVKASSHASEGNSGGDPPQSTKNVDLPSNDHLDKGENLSEARGGETIVKLAAPGHLDVHRSKAESSQQIIEKEAKTDSIGEKTKKKRKKSRRSTGENLPLVEMKDPNSDAFELTPMSTTLNDTTSEHASYKKSMKAPLHTSEGNKKGGPPQSISNVDPLSGDRLDKGETNLSQARGAETIVRAVEPLDVDGTKVESSQQIIEKELNFDCTEEKTKKKKRKSRRSTRENLPRMEMKDPYSDAFEPTTMTTTLNDASYEHTRYMKPMKAPSHTIEGNSEDDPPQSIRDVDLLPSGDHLGGVNNHSKAVNERDTINFGDYFVPRQLQQEALAPNNSVVHGGTKENGVTKKVKGKRTKKADTTVDGSSSWLQSSVMSNGPQDGQKSPTGNSYSIQLQESLANDKNGKEPPVGPGSTDLTLLSSKSDKFKIIAEEAPGAKVIVATPNLEKDSEASAASGSDMKRTKNVKAGNNRRSEVDRYRLAVRKSSHQHTGEVVGTSERKKSLLATSVAIFKDESSGSSAEAEGIEGSYSSTRTPSDTLLSGYSDGDSNANLNSPRDGNLSRKYDGGSSMKKSQSSDRKDLTLDRILRSSSRYKKAKLVASQSQLEDSESQPLEFVPDSQAIS